MTVTFSAELTEAWFKARMVHVVGEMQKVIKALDGLGIPFART